jgi:OOP family OmpA-OmpF porin/outer membrane immunogenic protein
MRHLLIATATAVAISASFTSFAAAAADASPAGGFVHFGAGQVIHDTSLSTYFDGKRMLGYDLLGGYRWAIGNSTALGFEAGAAHLGASEQFKRGAANRPTVKNGLGANAWLTGANVKWAMGSGVSLTGRLGLAYVNVRATSEVITSQRRSLSWTHLHGVTRYVGLGAGYALTEQFDLTLQATHYTSIFADASDARLKLGKWSATTVNLGAEYRF